MSTPCLRSVRDIRDQAKREEPRVGLTRVEAEATRAMELAKMDFALDDASVCHIHDPVASSFEFT